MKTRSIHGPLPCSLKHHLPLEHAGEGKFSVVTPEQSVPNHTPSKHSSWSPHPTCLHRRRFYRQVGPVRRITVFVCGETIFKAWAKYDFVHSLREVLKSYTFPRTPCLPDWILSCLFSSDCSRLPPFHAVLPPSLLSSLPVSPWVWRKGPEGRRWYLCRGVGLGVYAPSSQLGLWREEGERQVCLGTCRSLVWAVRGVQGWGETGQACWVAVRQKYNKRWWAHVQASWTLKYGVPVFPFSCASLPGPYGLTILGEALDVWLRYLVSLPLRLLRYHD